ncbi:MAG: hypothetical protein C4297_11045 [Gemmataceae bacterium]
MRQQSAADRHSYHQPCPRSILARRRRRSGFGTVSPAPRVVYANGAPGTRDRQSWGWAYQILPYIEQENLWKLINRKAPEVADQEIAKTPVSLYFCPSRRGTMVIANVGSLARLGNRAPIDYAGCSGSFLYVDRNYHPAEAGHTHHKFYNGVFNRTLFWDSNSGQFMPLNSPVRITEINDGTSNTLMIAEKRLNVRFIPNPQPGDAAGFVAGVDPDIEWLPDTVRLTDTVRSGWFMPARDANDTSTFVYDGFGSSHPTSFNALFADGSVRSLRYDVAPGIFQAVCTRNDGELIDFSLLE